MVFSGLIGVKFIASLVRTFQQKIIQINLKHKFFENGDLKSRN